MHLSNAQNAFKQLQSLRIVALGDVMLGGLFSQLWTSSYDFPIPHGIKETLDSADLVIANLEAPFSSEEHVSREDKIRLWAHPESANFLDDLNISLVSLANNHIFDCGLPGFEETKRTLDKYGIKAVGAGRDIARAIAPARLNIRDIIFDVLAFSWTDEFLEGPPTATDKQYGVAPLDLSQIKEGLSNSAADFKLVLLHWGEELTKYPLLSQKKVAQSIFDYGADMIIGSHPHTLQGVETKGGKIVAFSMGNFLFSQYRQQNKILTMDESAPLQKWTERSSNSALLAIDIPLQNTTGGIQYKWIKFTMDPDFPILKSTQNKLAVDSKLYKMILNTNLTFYSILFPFFRRIDEFLIFFENHKSKIPSFNLKLFKKLPSAVRLARHLLRLILKPERF